MTAEDWPAVARIYRAGIAAGNATFEHVVPEWEPWRAARLEEPCWSLVESGNVLGWAALTPVSSRPVYRGVAEVSVYVDPDHARRGIGRALLASARRRLRARRHMDATGRDLPGERGIDPLHESCGFRVLGTHQRMGQMPDGRWRDVVLYERRSEVVGRA